ncbi:MAG: hypothetical protein ACOYVK_11245 [Bacillota bacterium]
MRKISIVLLWIVLFVYAVGCSSTSTDDSVLKIVPPQNRQIPIQGTWKIDRVLLSDRKDQGHKDEEWIGENVQFSDKYMVFGENLLEKPGYSIRRVKGEEYLLYNHKSFPKDFTLPNKEIEAITITEEDKYFCEVLRINDQELVLEIYNYSFYLKKVSDEVDEHLYEQAGKEPKEGLGLNRNSKEDIAHTGVLVGLRIPQSRERSGEGTQGYAYKTLWIASKDKTLAPILEKSNIFFPRKSGFWKLEVKEVGDGTYQEDIITAYNVMMEDENKMPLMDTKLSLMNDKTGYRTRRIDYVGNDYTAVEVSGEGTYKDSGDLWKEDRLQILPIDSLPHVKGVTIWDLSGSTGLVSMKNGWKRLMAELGIGKEQLLNFDTVEESFGLERKMGHWFYKGRINYTQGQEMLYADYPIHMIPSSKLVFYDELSVPWTVIKDQIPGAVDAFTSPNQDIALIVTKNELLVYAMSKDRLENAPLQRVPLEEGAAVIMAEWGTGHYVEKWEKAFESFNDESH